MSKDFTTILEKSQVWLKENTKRYAFKKLEKDIVSSGVCTECGLCVGICPVNAISPDPSSSKFVPTLTGDCTACGLCYAMCPRTHMIPNSLIGDIKSIWRIQAKQKYPKSQDGGVASAIVSYLLQNKMIDGAIVSTHKDTDWKPISGIVKEAAKIADSAGTIYSHASVVKSMMEAYKDGLKSLAIVGTSCNLEAVYNLQTHPAGFFQINDGYEIFKIALFCMESFNYEGLVGFLRDNNFNIKNVSRMAISSGKFRITVNSEEHEWPIADLDSIASSSCSYCTDFTCRTSDISCGNVGSEEGWTTVLVRSEKGEKVIRDMIKRGLIEAEPLDSKSADIIERVARTKTTRLYGKVHD